MSSELTYEFYVLQPFKSPTWPKKLTVKGKVRPSMERQPSVHTRVISAMENTSVKGTYKAVIFDFGGVLTEGDIVQFFYDTEAKYGVPKYTIFKLGSEKKLGEKLDKGENTLLETAEMINELVREQMGVEEFDLVTPLETVEQNYLKPCPAMEELARCLRRKGLKLAVLTNNWKRSQSSDKSYLNIDTSLYDVIVDSTVVSMRKPDAEIYQLTLERLGVASHQAIFLDDIQPNIKGAEDAGIKSILVDPSDKVKAIQELADCLQLDLTEAINML